MYVLRSTKGTLRCTMQARLERTFHSFTSSSKVKACKNIKNNCVLHEFC